MPKERDYTRLYPRRKEPVPGKYRLKYVNYKEVISHPYEKWCHHVSNERTNITYHKDSEITSTNSFSITHKFQFLFPVIHQRKNRTNNVFLSIYFILFSKSCNRFTHFSPL